ncbi:unnamed protein product [Acanthosepion pharaonis]|uniref:Uncharacterized protein n=1 Tax=Acanthosepion pharaonis TaxID=158019 RepID=A0A812CFX3_ACAPH|nr:unnamed protein product [Sepia pharaonis]
MEKPSPSSLKFYLGLILFGHLIKPSPSCFVRIPLIICQRAWTSVFPEIPPGTYPLWSPDQTRLLPALCEYFSSSLSEGHGKPSVFPKFPWDLSSLVTSSNPSPSFCANTSSSLSEGHRKPPSLKFYLGLILFGHLIKPVSFLHVRIPSSSLSEGMESPPSSLNLPGTSSSLVTSSNPVSFLLCANTSSSLSEGMEKSSVFPEILPGLILFGHLIKPEKKTPVNTFRLKIDQKKNTGKYQSVHQPFQGRDKTSPSSLKVLPKDRDLSEKKKPVNTSPFKVNSRLVTVRQVLRLPCESIRVLSWTEIKPVSFLHRANTISPDQTCLCVNTSLSSLSEGHGSTTSSLKFLLGLSVLVTSSNLSPSCFVRIPLIITVRGHGKALMSSLKFPWDLSTCHLIKPVSFMLCANTLIITVRGHKPPSSPEIPPGLILLFMSNPSLFLLLCEYLSSSLEYLSSSSLSEGQSPPSSLKIPPGTLRLPEILPGTYPLWSLHQTCPSCFGEYLSSSLSEGHGKFSVFPEIPWDLFFGHLIKPHLLPALCEYFSHHCHMSVFLKFPWASLWIKPVSSCVQAFPEGHEIPPPGTYPFGLQTRLLPALCEYLSSSLSEGMESPPRLP